MSTPLNETYKWMNVASCLNLIIINHSHEWLQSTLSELYEDTNALNSKRPETKC